MTKATGKGRGGYRAGAGRKTEDGAVIAARISATITQEHVDLIHGFHPTNDTVGLRMALDELIRLRKASKGIVSIKDMAPPQNGPMARKSILRVPSTPVVEPPRVRDRLQVDNDWEVERMDGFCKDDD